MHPRRTQGFTLIELMIVVTILAIIASIALPNLMSARSTANEKSVVAALRAIVTAQQLARTNATVDLNNNGQGEAATLGELAGTQTMRSTTTFLAPSYLSASLGSLDADGHVSRHGFYFALYLPNLAGTGMVATPANLAAVNPTMSESFWSVVAWPRSPDTQGNQTMFTNQVGDVLGTRNTSYVGKSNAPPAGCALLGVAPTDINTSKTAANTVGADGNYRRIVP